MKGEFELEVKSAKRIRKVYIGAVLAVVVVLLSANLAMMIRADAPASAPNTVIDGEELTVYKLNGIRFAVDGTLNGIQAAIEDLPNAGGLVIVPNGTYTWTSIWSPTKDNFGLIGSGSTTIRCNFDATPINLAGRDNIYLGSLNIDGMSSTKTAPTSLLFINGCTNITIRDVHVWDWYGSCFNVYGTCDNILVDSCTAMYPDTSIGSDVIAFAANNGKNIICSNNYLTGAVYALGVTSDNVTITENTIIGFPLSHGGIYARNGANNVIISNNHVSGFGHAGIEVRGRNITMTGNILTENVESGLEMFTDDATDYAQNMTAIGNIITNNIGDGILILNTGTHVPRCVSIIGNVISGNGGQGIHINGEVDNFLISGNQINQNDVGVKIVSALAHDISVLGNTFVQNGYGIQSYGYCISIADNQISQCTAGAGIIIGGSNQTLSGNFIHNWTLASQKGILLNAGCRDISILGNTIFDMYGAAIGILVLSTGKRILINDNKLNNIGIASTSAYGIKVAGTDNTTIANNLISFVGGTGISIDASSELVSVTGNVITKIAPGLTTQYGIYISAIKLFTVADNILSFIGGDAIYISGASKKASIMGNEIYAAAKRGIYVSGSSNMSLVGNIVIHCGTSSNIFAGMYAYDSKYLTFTSNIAMDDSASVTQTYGLQSAGTSDYLIVIANIFTPNLTGNYTLSGSNNIVYGNL